MIELCECLQWSLIGNSGRTGHEIFRRGEHLVWLWRHERVCKPELFGVTSIDNRVLGLLWYKDSDTY
jgi:hypothetical protein